MDTPEQTGSPSSGQQPVNQKRIRILRCAWNFVHLLSGKTPDAQQQPLRGLNCVFEEGNPEKEAPYEQENSALSPR